MTESEFLAAAEAVLAKIEKVLEHVADNTDLDIECSRSGNVLEIELIDNKGSKSKIIVNIQEPMQELWIAAKSGGFHYKHDGVTWVNTRGGPTFFAELSRMIRAQAGAPIDSEIFPADKPGQ